VSPHASTSLLALDWGTSSARAYRLGAGGVVLDRREAPLGVMQLREGEHAAALAGLLGDWASERVPRIACGMIGSRQGWIEAPYVECPADVPALVCGLRTTPGGEMAIVPGLVYRDGEGVPDVLRGEETQIVGATDADGESMLAVLPGTHCKWVRVESGRIVSFATYMTGELFAVLLQHSILGRLAAAPQRGSPLHHATFADGVARGMEADGLSHVIFGARTRCLLGELAADEVGDWLSGVLIGNEIAAARRWAGASVSPATPVHIIGNDALVERYQVALSLADVRSEGVAPDAAARGLYTIARRAGMVQ
jgi:2-dehydro-3-deoxygalactonokinase